MNPHMYNDYINDPSVNEWESFVSNAIHMQQWDIGEKEIISDEKLYSISNAH